MECRQDEVEVSRVPEEKKEKKKKFNKMEERLYPSPLSSLHFGAVAED